MRKTQILALLLSMVMIFSSFLVTVYAEEVALSELTASEQSALALLEALDIADASAQGFITRAQFVKNAARLVKIQALGYHGIFPFGDVAPDSDIYAILGNFSTLGIISPASEFFSDRIVSENEAIKIIVSALGYDDYAKSLGGYPTGYIATANRIDLFTSFDGDAKLSTSEMTNLLFSSLHSKIRYVVMGSGEANSDITVLEYYHNLSVFEEQITAIDRTGLTDPNLGTHEDYIRIGSELFDISLVPELKNYLGYRINAYISTDSSDDKVYAYEIATENVVTLSADEAEAKFSEFRVTALEKKYTLSRDYQIIYNGVALESAPDSELDFEDGTYVLIDSDNNRSYDVIHIWKTEYVVVDTFAYDGSVITDTNKTAYGVANQQMLVLNDDDVFYDFILPGGSPCDVTDLAEMPALAVNISYNSEYIRVEGINTTVKGALSAVSESVVEIGESVYTLSAYAKNLTWNPSGEEVTLLLTENGEALALIDEVSKMKYGYIMQIKRASGLDEDAVYMLCESGDKKLFTLKDKLVIDAVPADATQALDSSKLHNYQLVRYTANSADVINCIDTESADNLYADNINPIDELRFYGKEKNVRWYKSTGYIKQLYAPKKAVVFCVPVALYDDPSGVSYKFNEDDFYISSISSLNSYTYIDYAIYDVTEERDCGSLIRYANDNPETTLGVLGEYSSLGAVERISNAMDNDGNAVRLVTIVSINGFKKLYFSKYLNDLFDNEKRSLNVGDIVRYTTIGNTISNLRVEYDFKAGIPVTGLTSPDVYSAENPGSYGAASTIYYHDGTLFNYTTKDILIKDDYDGIVRVVPYGEVLAIRYDKKSERFRPIDLASARMECSVGAALADKVVCVVRQTESTYLLMLYEQ